jgi:5-methyltetrahydrofolate--homocysteine methyltransferase
MVDLKKLSECIQTGDIRTIKTLTQEALEQGTKPTTILNELITGLDVIGDKFKKGEIYLPEMLVSGKAMQNALEVLRPKLVETGAKPVGKAVIGTVRGDVHDIGKNMFGMMLEGAGFTVKDLGSDVSAEKFVQAVKEGDCQLLGMSALLSTTMAEMPKVIEALKEAGVRNKVKILIGGAPITQKYADQIGAEGYGIDAATGVDMARVMIGSG